MSHVRPSAGFMFLVFVALGVVLCGLLGGAVLLLSGFDGAGLPLGGLWPTWFGFIGVGAGFGIFVWPMYCLHDVL